jgi:hypothetical protein
VSRETPNQAEATTDLRVVARRQGELIEPFSQITQNTITMQASNDECGPVKARRSNNAQKKNEEKASQKYLTETKQNRPAVNTTQQNNPGSARKTHPNRLGCASYSSTNMSTEQAMSRHTAM